MKSQKDWGQVSFKDINSPQESPPIHQRVHAESAIILQSSRRSDLPMQGGGLYGQESYQVLGYEVELMEVYIG